MESLTEAEIIAAFDGQEPDLPVPDLSGIDWEVLEFYGWLDPGGRRAYMVVISPEDGLVKGITLERSRFSPARGGFEMCSLCNHVHTSNGTAMFTIDRRNSERQHSIGNIVCKDLACSLRVRNLINPPNFLRETLYKEARIWRMQIALHKWLRSADYL